MRNGHKLGIAAAAAFGTCIVVALPSSTAASGQSDEPFEINGDVTGLYPGATATLVAEVDNPHPVAVSIDVVDVTVGDATSACPAGMLHVAPLAEPVVVAAGATGTVPLTVTMDRLAPDACQNVEFPLVFSAMASLAEPQVQTTPPTTPATTLAPGQPPPPAPGQPPPAPAPATVPPTQPPSPDGLVATGTDVRWMLVAAGLLVVGGSAARRATRSRRW